MHGTDVCSATNQKTGFLVFQEKDSTKEAVTGLDGQNDEFCLISLEIRSYSIVATCQWGE